MSRAVPSDRSASAGPGSAAGMTRLEPGEYHRMATLLQDLPINTFFARAVLEGDTGGRVYVDDPLHPRACYVAHPYGMSLLFGDRASESFRCALGPYLAGESADRTMVEWLQVYPRHWSSVLEQLLGCRLVRPAADGTSAIDLSAAAEGWVIQDTRINFRFNQARYERLRASLVLPADCEIIDDAAFIYSTMRGSVVPSVFWGTADGFVERGIAFGVTYRGELASVAFASFVLERHLELGIETVERFRGRGLALHACSALIEFCLERHLEPVWACRLGNGASYRLAMRLGFDPIRRLPYYRLPLSPANPGCLGP
jgi:GNAT superfamily N-acetyltransferase